MAGSECRQPATTIINTTIGQLRAAPQMIAPMRHSHTHAAIAGITLKATGIANYWYTAGGGAAASTHPPLCLLQPLTPIAGGQQPRASPQLSCWGRTTAPAACPSPKSCTWLDLEGTLVRSTAHSCTQAVHCDTPHARPQGLEGRSNAHRLRHVNGPRAHVLHDSPTAEPGPYSLLWKGGTSATTTTLLSWVRATPQAQSVHCGQPPAGR
jgi:hypothetical protein